jgi:hypothetical protein
MKPTFYFRICGSEHKQLYIFKGGKHEDFLKRFPEEYDHLMNDFLTQNQ